MKSDKKFPELVKILEDYHNAFCIVERSPNYIKDTLSKKLRSAGIHFDGIELDSVGSGGIVSFGARITIMEKTFGIDKYIPEDWVEQVLKCLGYEMTDAAIRTRERKGDESLNSKSLTVEILVL